MKSPCEIVQDLLPLYVDGAVKPETAEFVSRHVKQCGHCRAEKQTYLRNRNWRPDYGSLEEAAPSVSEGEEKFIRQIRSWKRRLALAFVGFLTLGYTAMRLLE